MLFFYCLAVKAFPVTDCDVIIFLPFMIVTISMCFVSHVQRLTEEGVSDVLRHLIP